MAAPEYDKFVKTISAYSHHISRHSLLSWNGIDFSQTEPQIIKQYLLKKGVGIDYLNRNLAPVLSNGSYETKFASVFVHQKPRVIRTTIAKANCVGDTDQCELGDLLIVFCFLDSKKNPIHCTALLSQAKKHERLDSLSQACLYDSDITFEMPRTICQHSVYKTPIRNFPDYSEGRSKALNYTLLSKNTFSRHIPWSVNISHDWDVTMQRIICGDLGLTFGGPVIAPDWNCIINDLLQIGTGIIRSSISRGSHLEDIVNVFNDFNEYEKYGMEIENAEGVSMMFVIVRDKDSAKES